MPTSPPRFHALLIGVDRYLPAALPKESYPSLAGCVNDVNRMAAYLHTHLGLLPEHVIRLSATDKGSFEPPEPPEQRPTYENIVAAFGRLQNQALPGDQVFVHYSGHGGRIATAFPEIKGSNGLDESLVPYDIGLAGARPLRDVELGFLLRRLVNKGLIVTTVLDCCHSGGLTRGGEQVRVRGVDFPDGTARPADSLVTSREELLAFARREGAGFRGMTAAEGGMPLAGPRDFVLLAACRPNERAHEFAFEEEEASGALTHSLLEALEVLTAGQTYKELYDRVLARVHSHFVAQTPMLQGEAERVVLAADRASVRSPVRVMQVEEGGNRVQLQTGQATGVSRGAHFVTYPRGWADLEAREGRTGLFQVVERGATDSWAKRIEPYGNTPVAQGDQAVMLGTGSLALVRQVRLLRADGLPPTPADTALEAVREEIAPDKVEQDTLGVAGRGWLELAGHGKTEDYQVRVSRDGGAYEICDPSGALIPLRPEVWVSDPHAARVVVRRLIHLAKYRAVRELENRDANSPLQNALQVELLRLQDDFDQGDTPMPRPFETSADSLPTLRVGEWGWLRIKNVSDQVLNIAVLDLAPGWEIDQVHPRKQDFAPLDPGKELDDFPPLKAGLPPGYTEGEDVLKVFATVGPAYFRVLTLPPLDRPDGTRKGATRSGDRSPLDELLEAVAADQPRTRNLVPGMSPSHEWTTVSVRVRIVR
jgi:hypothetical protein